MFQLLQIICTIYKMFVTYLGGAETETENLSIITMCNVNVFDTMW